MSGRLVGRLPVLLASAALTFGCASTSPKDAVKDTSQMVEARSGYKIAFDQNTKEDDEARRAVDRLLLESEVTADSAVLVALLASPKLRATLEELSISQADLVQAGLLKNPVFEVGATAWEREHIDPNLFASVEQSFLDLITLPLKKRVAEAELEATKLRVADHVLEVVADVRAAFYRAQAAEQVLQMRRLVEGAAQAAGEVAKQQHAAGNMSDLALNVELTLAAQTSLDLKRSEAERIAARESLNKLIGAWGKRTGWKMSSRLPELPTEPEVPLDHLESRAIADRLDLNARRRELQAIDYTLSLAKTTRWTGAIDVHVQAGRLRDSKHFSFGPSVLLEIPLFDQRQAAIARLEALQRQNDDELQALAIDIRADVRATHARLLAARAIVTEYGKTLVPLRENIVRFSQQQYDAMLLGVYQLLAARQAELDAYREYIESLRDYWIARSDLERVLGSRLSPASPRAK